MNDGAAPLRDGKSMSPEVERRTDIVVRVLLTSIIVAAGMGCESDPTPTPLAHEFEIDARLGEMDGEADMLTNIWQAAALSDGRIVVLDRSSPFVRVFSRDGRSPTAFMEQGGGPGESRRPGAIAVVGDDKIAVSDANGISLFMPDGRFLSRTRLPQPAIDIVGDCNGRLLVYGPMMMTVGDSTAWLTAFEVDSTVVVESLTVEFRDVISEVEFGYGKRVLAADDSAVALIHENAVGRPLQLFSCRPGDPGLRHVLSTPIAPDEITNPQLRSGLREGSMVTFGIAVVDGHPYWQETVLVDLLAVIRHVTLRTLDGDKVRIAAEGSRPFAVLNRHRTGLLLGVDEPFPRVLITTMIRHADDPLEHNAVALDSLLLTF